MLLLGSVSSISVFAYENTSEQQEEMEFKSDRAERKYRQQEIKEVRKNLNVNAVVATIRTTIEDFMLDVETVIMTPFKSYSTEYKGMKNIFRILVSIFLIVSCFYFIFQIVADPHFQATEIPMLFVKCAFVFFAFWLFPTVAPALKRFMWRVAEIICGANANTMSYTTGLYSMNAPTFFFIIGLGLVGIPFSYFTPAVSSLSTLEFGIAFAGLIATLGAVVVYCTWVLELYLATYVLLFYLPACLFKGFDYRIMNVVKFYFVNALEVFLGAIIFLLAYRIKFEVNGNNIIEKLVYCFIKPLIVVIFLPMSSKIIGAIVSGSSLADTSGAAGRAFSGMLRTLGVGGVGKAIMDGIKNSVGRLSGKKASKKQSSNGNSNSLKANTDADLKHFNRWYKSR